MQGFKRNTPPPPSILLRHPLFKGMADVPSEACIFAATALRTKRRRHQAQPLLAKDRRVSTSTVIFATNTYQVYIYSNLFIPRICAVDCLTALTLSLPQTPTTMVPILQMHPVPYTAYPCPEATPNAMCHRAPSIPRGTLAFFSQFFRTLSPRVLRFPQKKALSVQYRYTFCLGGINAPGW